MLVYIASKRDMEKKQKQTARWVKAELAIPLFSLLLPKEIQARKQGMVIPRCVLSPVAQGSRLVCTKQGASMMEFAERLEVGVDGSKLALFI